MGLPFSHNRELVQSLCVRRILSCLARMVSVVVILQFAGSGMLLANDAFYADYYVSVVVDVDVVCNGRSLCWPSYNIL